MKLFKMNQAQKQELVRSITIFSLLVAFNVSLLVVFRA